MSDNKQLISKIAARTVCGKIIKPEKPHDLFSVYGVASGVAGGESSFGDWEALTGTFEAVNHETGEVFQSPRCFLPRVAHGLIAAQFHGEKAEKDISVRFAVVVGIKPSNMPVGYEYTVRPLVKPQEDDALAQLRGEVEQRLPRLEKPKTKV